MDKKYTSTVRQLTARPRSKRLRELGGTIVGGGSVSVSVGDGAATSDPDGHRHSNLDVLERITTDDEDYICLNDYVEETDPDTGEETGDYIVKKERAKVGFADLAGALAEEAMEMLMEMFLRKDQDDRTPYRLNVGDLLTAEGGMETLDAVLSFLLGKGTIIKDGLIQTDRIEVRQSMTVMDLIINQLQGIAADFLFSDVGKVDEVTELADGVYVLHIEKKTDYDFTTLGENDILKMVVNDLYKGGGNYYSSWMLVRSVDTDANEVTVAVYDDSQVQGGRNFAPVAGYNVARMGNAVADTENERANFWMLSGTEGRMQFLQSVFSPIMEDYNYALTLGKLPDIKAIGNLPVTPGKDVGIVAKVGIFEKLYQFDYNGDIVPEIVDRGNWYLAVAQSDAPYRYVQHERTYEDGETTYTELEQHTVWHNGCRWGCLVDKTTEEPKWNSTHWSLLEGNTELEMRFTSSEGNAFAAGKVDTYVTPSVYLGNIDISGDIAVIDWLWTYETGEYNGRVLHLTNELMPPTWSRENKAKFTCTAYVRKTEDDVTEVSNYVSV